VAPERGGEIVVLSGSPGEWIFVLENGKASHIMNLRKFAVLV
jgi:hypothetical protein